MNFENQSSIFQENWFTLSPFSFDDCSTASPELKANLKPALIELYADVLSTNLSPFFIYLIFFFFLVDTLPMKFTGLLTNNNFKRTFS